MYSIHTGYRKISVKLLKKEIALIKWNPTNKTIFHGHNGKKCTFIPLNGILNETILYSDGKCIKNIHSKYSVNTIVDGVHQVENRNNRSVYSLHFYR